MARRVYVYRAETQLSTRSNELLFVVGDVIISAISRSHARAVCGRILLRTQICNSIRIRGLGHLWHTWWGRLRIKILWGKTQVLGDKFSPTKNSHHPRIRFENFQQKGLHLENSEKQKRREREGVNERGVGEKRNGDGSRKREGKRRLFAD